MSAVNPTHRQAEAHQAETDGEEEPKVGVDEATFLAHLLFSVGSDQQYYQVVPDQ